MKRKWVYAKKKRAQDSNLGADAGASMPVISPEVMYTKEPEWVEPKKPDILVSVPWWIWALGVFMFFIDDEGG